MAANPLAALAERARSTGEEPWLFHRDELDWQWRSWGRVADHLARGVAPLRAASAQPIRIGFDARPHPDALTAGLAIQAAGHLAVPVAGGAAEAAAGCDAWAGVGFTAGQSRASGDRLRRVELPPASSPLDRVELEPLALDDAAQAVGAIELPGRGLVSPADLASSARRLGRRLPAGGGRPIVCAAPDLDQAAVQLLQAWTLIRGAAWVLEPLGEAFVETVLWARPTVVWAPAAGLERLAARMGTRKHRWRSRVAYVVVAGGGEIDPERWRALGVEVVELGEDPLTG